MCICIWKEKKENFLENITWSEFGKQNIKHKKREPAERYKMATRKRSPASKLSRALWRPEGKRKESLLLRPWNLNIYIEKVGAKCWLAEMTLVVTSLPLARVFQCLFTFALVLASRWLVEIWQLNRQGATGELEVEFNFQRRSCKLSFLFLPRRQSAPESLLAGYKTVTSATNTRVFATLSTRRELELKFVSQLFLGSWTRLSAIG